MSRLANPASTKPWILAGGCLCEGKPHEADVIQMRTELGAADAIAVAEARTNVEVLELMAVSWNLVDDAGNPHPLNVENLGLLFSDDYDALDHWTEENVKMAALPKPSGDPSSTGTPASDRPNRAARRQRRSTRS